jgi:hypothetical protein
MYVHICTYSNMYVNLTHRARRWTWKRSRATKCRQKFCKSNPASEFIERVQETYFMSKETYYMSKETYYRNSGL